MIDYFDRQEEFREILKNRLKGKRFRHSLNVADSSLYLAKKYGADEKKAYIAGLLHDCTKNETEESQLNFFADNGIILTQLELSNPKLWHAMTAPLFVRNELGIDDEELLLALRFHTTGRAGMSLLEKIVYIADYISLERDYPDVDVMRSLADKSLEMAALYSLKYSLSSLSHSERVIHPDSLSFYNELIMDGITTEKEE